MSEIKIYIDGKWFPKSEAKLSVYDHGVLYGDGVFEGIRAYQGHIFRLKEHLQRLYKSAEKISLKMPVDPNQMGKLLNESLQRNNLKDAYIRLLATRGVGDLGLDINACPKPSIIIIADKLALYPAKFYQEGLESWIVNVRRNIPEALDPTIKSMNYLNMILAKIEAGQHGVGEAIMLNNEGYVAECSGDNIFFVKGNQILTPPVSAGVLEGITRAAVIQLITQKTKHPFQEKLFTPEELLQADEVFFTGTAAEVIPVTKINQKTIGKGIPGPITQELIKLFHLLTQSESQATPA